MSEANYSVGYSLPNDEDYALVKLGPALDEAAALGVDYVELPLYAIDLVANGRIVTGRLKRVREITGGRPFGYTIHGPLGLNLMDSADRVSIHRDVLKATIEITAELGGVHYVAHCGSVPREADEPADALYARQREILFEMGDFAAQHGVTIAVENLFGNPSGATLPSRLAQEIAAIGHPAVRACLDFSHAYLLSGFRGTDFFDEAAALAPYAKHLHIHDSFGKLSPHRSGYRSERLAYGHGDLHLPLGLGSIPWDELIARCQFFGKIIFINELAPPYWPDLAETVARTRELAAKAKIAVDA